jgi:DNA polymerase III subunit alpha
MCDFSHLHCHTQYSLLDGAARIKKLVSRAAELEMSGLAITDHGNLFGVPEFYHAAKGAGIRPIIGCEFYIAPSGMQERADRTRYHQVLLAKNEVGYRNLIKLSSLSYTDGYYYKPRIDRETLARHSEGLIATTCCLQGEVLQTILHRGEDAARQVFEAWLGMFGDDYYVEIQDHGIADQKRCNEVLLRWAKEYGVKVIATNDVHYVNQADSEAQDVLLCLQTGKDYNDPNRMRFENDQFYLKDVDQMRASLPDLPAVFRDEILDTTREIVDKCALELSMGKLLMPHYPIPEEFGGDMDLYLRHLVFEGAKTHYPGVPQHVVDRIDYELGIIKEMGYAGYFLIVQDFTTAARKLGVRVGPGRGSAAGSAVAFCLGVTNIDPLKYDLLFERFLNPERVSMPDIDIDFDDRGRGRVIDYVVQKYGRDNVCQIITFGTMGAKSVLRDVARVLDIPLAEADRIAKLVPDGPSVSLAKAAEEVPEFRALQNDSDPQIRRLLHYAHVLEGSARHTGVHAAGVIIAPGTVSDYVPVAVAKSKNDEVLTTQYDGKWVENFGLLKMDFLGLKTLTVLNDALNLIKENHGVDIDIDDIPFDDEKAYRLFQNAETVSIFQFESSGMREWLRKLKPTNLDDLIAMNALYRPGPMQFIPVYIDRKHGREKVEMPHPMLEEILSPTYGIPVYQEQVMQMAQTMAGYTLGGADILRRIMGKKKPEEMANQRAIFVEGAVGRGVEEKKANEVFDMMATFAGYGFNKSHSAAYSVVAYQTAYLKANYPAEFMAAAMTNEMNDTKKLSVVLEEARRMEIEILPPSVHSSSAYFTVEEGKIRFGLGAIKGVGMGAIESIIRGREEHGQPQTLFAFVRDLDLRAVNKKALECLAACGALDELEGHRAQLAASVDAAVQYAQRLQADKLAGQSSLFGGSDTGTSEMEPALVQIPAWSRAQMLKQERELIGVYVSGHPLEAYLPEARAFATADFSRSDVFETEAAPSGDGAPSNGRSRGPVHTFCGIITDISRRTTKSGKPIAFVTLEDFSGQGELICFSSTFDKVQNYLKVDEIVLARGETEVRGGIKVIVQDIWPMWKVREQMVKSITLGVDIHRMKKADLDAFREVCDANRGQCKLYFDVRLDELEQPARLHARRFVVDASQELMTSAAKIFGRESVFLSGE